MVNLILGLKKNFFIILSVIAFSSSTYANKVDLDTIYYDRDWKVIKNSCFADYYKIFEKSTSESTPNRFRNFYINGEIHSSGNYISIDSIDDNKSLLDGEIVSYYRNGKVESIHNFNKGIKDGESITYDEEGLIRTSTTYKNGLLHGLYTSFDEKGVCYQTEYSDGLPKYDYYVLSTTNGLYSKFRTIYNKPIYSSVKKSDIRIGYTDNLMWGYYMQDAVAVISSYSIVKSFKRHYRISINITNNSFRTLTFDPTEVIANSTDKKGNQEILELRVENEKKTTPSTDDKETWDKVIIGEANDMIEEYTAATSYTSIKGLSLDGGLVSLTGVTKTKITNPIEINKYRSEKSQNMTTNTRENFQRIVPNRIGHIKKVVTIKPGESISGYFDITKNKCEYFEYILNIDGIQYAFKWDAKKKIILPESDL